MKTSFWSWAMSPNHQPESERETMRQQKPRIYADAANQPPRRQERQAGNGEWGMGSGGGVDNREEIPSLFSASSFNPLSPTPVFFPTPHSLFPTPVLLL